MFLLGSIVGLNRHQCGCDNHDGMTKENARSNACVSLNEYSIDNILTIHPGFYNLKAPLDYLRIKSRKPQFNKLPYYSNEI